MCVKRNKTLGSWFTSISWLSDICNASVVRLLNHKRTPKSNPNLVELDQLNNEQLK